MSVHYKFKSALDFDTITFDGLHISVFDLKKAIIHQKRLGKTADFDLQITNAQTKEEYNDDTTLIPKNTSLIIARIPLASQPKKPWDPHNEKTQGMRQAAEPDGGSLDLSQMNGTEEDKIQAMMIQSTIDYDPNNYQKLRGQGQTGEVPANYRCFKCHKPGHWIKNCSLGSSSEMGDVKRNTGIPRSFIERDSQETSMEKQIIPPSTEQKQEIPEDLLCSMCKDLFTDAVMIPCCGSSFCDECVRTALLESEDNECPDCKEKGSSPGSLIPNRFLRNSVNAFKNETGYSKPRPRKDQPIIKETNSNFGTLISSTNSNSAGEGTNVNPDAHIKDKKDDKYENSKEKKGEDIKSKGEVVTHSSHDEIESDFEDNITVTVPPAYLQGQKPSYIERQHIGRFSKTQKNSAIDNSPKHNQSSHTTPPASEQKSGTPTIDEKDNISEHMPDQSLKHNSSNAHHTIARDSIRSHRGAPSDIYSGSPMAYPSIQSLMLPSRPYEMGSYGVPPGPPYVPFIMGENMRGPYHPPRSGYPSMHQIRPRHIPPPGILASVYQGVAAKVGTGIIDDPLEAFNRIMREKEKRKEERRRSPNRRRSRSIELNIGRSRPVVYNRPRARSPEERRQRSPLPRERRGRSRERDKRSIENDKRRHQSSSFSDRSSRSRSWSIPPRRRTKSPPARRRSRSRSPSFSMARYRPKESRRIERREDFSREEFRDRSPYHHQSRRARSRGRILSPMQHRQSRVSGHNQDILSHQVAPIVMYNEGLYSQNNRYNRDIHVPPPRKELCGRDRNDYQSEIFDEEPPPGTDEPPPPGFEISPQRNSRNRNQFDDRGCRSDYYEHDNKISYNDRGQAADIRDIQSLESDMCNRIDGKDREGRSWSRTSPNIVRSFDKRRRSCSRSPLRGDRFVEHYQNRARIASRERFINRDRHSAERHGNERERIEQERRRERSIRERKSPKMKADEIERKVYEKEIRQINRDEKYREKHKELEKEKKLESSEDEKKDKKCKEKKKKKRDPEKKKNKKEKKEKKEKEKEKEREKDNVNINEFLIEKNIEEEIQVNDEKHGELIGECVEKIRGSPSREDGELADSKIGAQLLDSEQIDLYGDICQDDKINLDYSNIAEEGEIQKSVLAVKSSPMDMKRFDSVLDIHDFEPDIDDIAKDEIKKEVGVLVPIPELSKWEREEENQIKEEKKITLTNDAFSLNDEKSGKVTNEVIRRAENAIFARAINAIRPIEIKKISLERQKLYSNESTKEISPPISVMVKTQSPGKEITSFQITVPANSNFSERSVEIKSDKQKKSPVRSVKDRLGSKILEPTNKRNRSGSTTPIRKVTLECNRIEKVRLARSKSKERYRGENVRDQSNKAGEVKRIHDNREREKNVKEYKIMEPNRSREQTRNRDIDRRGHGHNRMKDRSWDQERYRERARDKEKEKDRRRKSVDRGRERYIGDSRFKERNKSIEHDKLRNRGQKRDRSRSKSVDKKERKIKREKENKRKHSEETKSEEREKKVKVGKIEQDCKEKVSQNKKAGLNENNCDPENGEQIEKKVADKTCIDEEKDKLKTPESNKRSHNPSSKSSTSSSSDSESDSNPEERKRKKRKYKKEKKRAKRGCSSAESSSSTKRKRSKSKKKSKSSKKKKKGKK